jgi:hypothetical protein
MILTLVAACFTGFYSFRLLLIAFIPPATRRVAFGYIDRSPFDPIPTWALYRQWGYPFILYGAVFGYFTQE